MGGKNKAEDQTPEDADVVEEDVVEEDVVDPNTAPEGDDGVPPSLRGQSQGQSQGDPSAQE